MASVKALRSASGGGYQEIGPSDRLAGDATEMVVTAKGATQDRSVSDVLGDALLPVARGVVANARLDDNGLLRSGATDQTAPLNAYLLYCHNNGIRPRLPRGPNGAGYLCLGEVGIYDEGDYEGTIYTPAEGARSAPISASGAIVSSDRATVTLANLIPGHRVVLYFNGVAGPATDVGLDGVAVWSVSGGVPVGAALTYDTAPGYALTIAPDPDDVEIVPLDEVQRWAGAVQGASRLRGVSPSRKGQCITLDTIDQALLERNGSTFTAVATGNNPATIARAADGYPNGTPIKFRVGANPPAPFASGTVDAPGPTYYVVARTQLTLKLSATLGGAPITPTTAGTAAYNLEAQDGSANALSVTIASDGIMRATHGAPLNRLITVSADSADPNVTPTLPAPLTAGTYYYAVNVTLDSLQIATSPGGAPISFSSAGAGTLTIYISTGGTRMGDVFVVDDEDGHISPPLIAKWDTTTTGRVFPVSISQAAPAYFARNGHPLRNGDPFTLETTGELPAPFQRDRFYFVVNAGMAGFNVALSVGGGAIAATTAGSGTHTLTAPLVAWTQGTFKAQTIRNRLSISPPRVVLYGPAVTPRGSVIQLTRCNTELRGIEVKGSSAAQTLVGLNLTGCTGATLHTPAMTDLGVGNTNYAIQVGLSADIDIYSPTGGGGRRSYDGQRAKNIRLFGGNYADAIGGHAQYGLKAIGIDVSVSNSANPFCLHFAGRDIQAVGGHYSICHPGQALFRARTDYMQYGGVLSLTDFVLDIDTRGSPEDREFAILDLLGPARTFDTLKPIEMPSKITLKGLVRVKGPMGNRKVYLLKYLKNFGNVNSRDILGTDDVDIDITITYEDQSVPGTPWTRILYTNPKQLVGKGPEIRVRGVPDLKVDAVPGSAAEATKTTGRAVFDIDIDGPVVMDLRGGSFRRADVRSPMIDTVNRRNGWQRDATYYEWNPALPFATNTSELFRVNGETEVGSDGVTRPTRIILSQDKLRAVITTPANARFSGLVLQFPQTADVGRPATFSTGATPLLNVSFDPMGLPITGSPPTTLLPYSEVAFELSIDRDLGLVWRYVQSSAVAGKADSSLGNGQLPYDFPTIADASAAGIPAGQRVVRVAGATVPGIGAASYVESAATTAGPGRFRSSGSTARWWEIVNAGSLSLEQLGALPGSSPAILAGNLAAVQAAALLTKVVRLDSPITVGATTDLGSYMDLTVVGRGKIDGLYRKRVVPDFAVSAAPQIAGDLSPLEHCPTSCRTLAAREVLIGDSISTYQANTFGRSCMLATVLERELRAQARASGRSVAFFDRAIGGAGWGSINGTIQSTPTRIIEWAGTTARAWLAYVKDLQPTRVFISFGMNPGTNISAILAAVTEIRSWRFGMGADAYTTDIVLLTNLVPRPYVGPGNPVDGTANSMAALELRDQAAGLIRSYAKWLRLGILDINRMCDRAVFGFDPTEGLMERVLTKTTITNGAAGTRQAYGHSVRWVLDPTKLATNGSTPIALSTGPGSGDKIEIVATTTPNVYNIVQSSGDGSDVLTIDIANGITITPPTDQTFDLIFERNGNYGVLYILGKTFEASYGETKPNLWSSVIVSRGGLYTPTITCAAAGAIDVIGFDYLSPTIVRPTLSVTDLFNDGVDQTYGGSPINHPGNRVEGHIYAPIIRAARLYDGDAFRLTGPRVLSYLDGAGVTRTWTFNDAGFTVGAGRLRGSDGLYLDAINPAPRITQGGSGTISITSGQATDTGYLEYRGGGLLANLSGGFQGGGTISHSLDNVWSFGTAAFRATQVFAASGTINTSDAREKLDRAGRDLADARVSPLTNAEIAWACALGDEIGIYTWKASYAEKGADARLHVGMTVQRAIALAAEHGIDNPMAYGFICLDRWDAVEPEEAVFEEVEDTDADGNSIIGEDGKPILRTKMVRPAIPGHPAGERYGFRYEELTLFIWAGERAAARKSRKAA